MDVDGVDLPASVLAAWGRQPQRSKGPRPEITLDRIVEAAIRIADTDGLDAVSMARVAQEIGSSTMALYRHVGSKDELVTLMVDVALGPPPDPPTESDDWRPAITHWSWSMRAAMQRHPWGVRVPIGGPPLTPCQVGWMEQGLTALRATPATEAQKLSIILLFSGYVRVDVSLNVDLAATFLIEDLPEDPVLSYRRALQAVTEGPDFPALHRMIAAGVLDKADHPDDEFIFGLERLLDGVAALFSSVRPQARAQPKPKARSRAGGRS